MPGVSMAMKALPSISKRTSTLSRVVPGTSLTIIRSASASVLTKVLLPMFRRPTMATFMSGSAGGSSSISSGGGSRSTMAADNSSRPHVIHGADRQHLAAETIELGGLLGPGRRLGLVGHAHHGGLHVAEPLVDLLVQRRDSVAAIHDEHDHVGQVDARLDLVLDLIGEVVDVFDAHPAGIDHLHETAVDLARCVILSRVTPDVGSTMAMRRRRAN